MIFVKMQPEPADFSESVREPGIAFLKKNHRPTNKQWKPHAYWQRSLWDMRQAYNCICAYAAHWISSDTGGHSIDHFIPKSVHPDLAYEWSNFRYASLKFNNRKGTHTILDPFRLEQGWFVIDFPSLLLMPDHRLRPHQKEAVQHTIDVLKLNSDDKCVEARQNWIEDFCKDEITFVHLQRKAPFIAYELQRQNLVRELPGIMGIKTTHSSLTPMMRVS